jgi:hypothetical protein
VRESLQGSPFNNVPTCFLHSELAAENTRIELRPGCSALHQQAFEKIHRETRKVGNQPVISIDWSRWSQFAIRWYTYSDREFEEIGPQKPGEDSVPLECPTKFFTVDRTE